MSMERAFDTCEALSCLAHDWGLYALNARLNAIPFKPAPNLTVDTLEYVAREMYDNGNEWLENNTSDPYEPRPIPAGVLLNGEEETS